MNVEIKVEELVFLEDHGLIPRALKETYAARHEKKFDLIAVCRNTMRSRKNFKRVEALSIVSLFACVLVFVGYNILLLYALGPDRIMRNPSYPYEWFAVFFTCLVLFFIIEKHEPWFDNEAQDFALALECLVQECGLPLEELSAMSKDLLETEVAHLLTRLAGEILEAQSEDQGEYQERKTIVDATVAFKQTFDSVKHLGLIPEKSGYGLYFDKAKVLRVQVGELAR